MAKHETNAAEELVHRIPRLPVILASIAIFLSLTLVALDRLFLPDRFAIKEVVVAGQAPNVDPAMVLAAVRGLGPRSWFSVDLGEVEQAAKTVPWVYQVSVRRKWPGKLIITVSQAEPVARWNNSRWLNNAAEPLVMPENFHQGGLPELSGPVGSEAEVLEMYADLADLTPGGFVIKALKLSPRGAWTAELQDSASAAVVAVRIGKQAEQSRFQRLMNVLGADVGLSFEHVAEIDLRYPNGFAVRDQAPENSTELANAEGTAPQQGG